MLSPLRHGSEIDLMSEFANPMPVRIISELLGVPQALHGTFVDASRAIAVFRGNPNRTVEEARAAQDALIELTEFFRKTVAERRRNKGSDLISLLIDIEEEGEVLTEEELYAQCIALLFAGHETTRNLIGNGMYTLLKNPKQAAELREKPEMIRSAVEELLRYESPVQFTALAVGGPLVKSHGVGKRSLEQIVVARCNAMQDVRQRIAPRFRKLLERSRVPLAD